MRREFNLWNNILTCLCKINIKSVNTENLIDYVALYLAEVENYRIVYRILREITTVFSHENKKNQKR